MHDRLKLANARRAAALQAARETAARADLAQAADATRRRDQMLDKAERARDERAADWLSAMETPRLDLGSIGAHARVLDEAIAEVSEASNARAAAADEERQCAAQLKTADARRRMSEARARKIRRRIQKRDEERALTTIEAMTLLRWSRP